MNENMLFDRLSDAVPGIVWIGNADGYVECINAGWSAFTGIPQTAALGLGWMEALHPADAATLVAEGSGLPAYRDAEFRLRRHDRVYQPYKMFSRPAGDGKWIGCAVTAGSVAGAELDDLVRDRMQDFVTAKGEMPAPLQWPDMVARSRNARDELTGLPNRRMFTEVLQAGLRMDGGRIGLMVVDLDHLKMIKACHGHRTGEAVIRLVARHLRQVKRGEEFLARLDSDEFAIIVPDAPDEAALMARARAIRAVLKSRLERNAKTWTCRPQVGCALGTAGESGADLLKRASLALYAVAGEGKETEKLFNPNLLTAALRQNEALELARLALREHWIVPFYQPIIDFKDHRIRGFEALLRIRHPEKGILSPAVVMDALDNPYFADTIGLRMTQLIVEDMSPALSGRAIEGQVSINLATENLVNDAFVDNLLSLLDNHMVPRNRIKLEVTERVLIDKLGPATIRKLGDLRKSGIGISLDDFGTGYASLFHLKSLPVDEIKIDRSFVSGLGTDANKGEIVQAILGLAKALGLATVAEGIETRRENLKLAEWGCDYRQGYLFGRPLPAERAKLLDLSQRSRHKLR